MTFGPEFTFLPSRAPHEIRSRTRGEKLIKRVNKWLTDLGCSTGLFMKAKLDPFRLRVPGDIDSAYAWCVEICPWLHHWETDWLDEENESYAGFMAGVDELFAAMKTQFGLVPAVSKRIRRNGEVIQREWPGGGMHVHVGADIFNGSPSWYDRMGLFHRNLVTDFANRPYIRWLLAQWSDNLNSACLVTERDYRKGIVPTSELVWSRSFCTHAIEPRFMANSKASYLTFEFRFIDMVRSAAELRAAVLLLGTWMAKIKHATLWGDVIPLEITRAKLREMAGVNKSRLHVKSWLDSMSLPDTVRAQLDAFYTRNYLTRIHHGKML